MKRALLGIGFAALISVPTANAQDTANRAAAIADRDAAEERYKRLNSAVEDLWTARAEQDKRQNAISEELRNLRAEMSKADNSKYATREELRSLAEKLQEIDNKRVADRKLIEDKFAELKVELRKLLNAPAPAASRKPKPQPVSDAEEKPAEKATDKTAENGAAGQLGAWHEIGSGQTLAAIVAAYNEDLKKQGKKTSLKMVLDANPGVKPNNLKIGQKVFIPVVPQ